MLIMLLKVLGRLINSTYIPVATFINLVIPFL